LALATLLFVAGGLLFPADHWSTFLGAHSSKGAAPLEPTLLWGQVNWIDMEKKNRGRKLLIFHAAG
jgi:hypothetical protein